jgi:NADH-quinone oxidoreductase subunit J
MLVNLDEAAKQRQISRQWPIALACLLGVGAAFGLLLKKGSAAFQLAKPAVDAAAAGAVSPGNTEQLADTLFRQYLLPFEIASVLLLVAVVGSVVMAKKRV